MLKQLAVTTLSSLLLLGLAQSQSAASDDPRVGAGQCSLAKFCVSVRTQPKQGSRSSDPEKKAKGSKGIPASAQACTVTKLEPQPPAGSQLWQGHKPGEGAIYIRVCPALQAAASANSVGLGVAGLQVFWAAQTPNVTIDPAVLAQQALDSMTLRGPDIQIRPKPRGRGVVGMPVWMWTTRTAETYGPNSASASAGGITVTATANVQRIVWNMGDGTTVTCTNAGTPYKEEFGMQDSPDCGTRYTEPSSRRPGNRYHVTATSTWQVTWKVNDGSDNGQITVVRNSGVNVRISEVQVLN